MPVDYETIQKIQKLGDDVLIGVAEVAALTGFSVLTVRQRKLPGLEPVEFHLFIIAFDGIHTVVFGQVSIELSH